MDKRVRRQLYKVIEKRVLAGECKSKIYAEYPDEKDSKLVARVLALIPTPARRKQFSRLNWILIATFGVVTAIKFIVVILFVMTKIPKGAVFIIPIAMLINIYTIWCVVNFRVVGYILIVAFGINSLSSLSKSLAGETNTIEYAINMTGFVFLIASMVIALVLRSKLFPQTSCLLMIPEKDESGRPVFEE